MTGGLFPGQNLAHGGQSNTCPMFNLDTFLAPLQWTLWARFGQLCGAQLVLSQEEHLPCNSMDVVRSKLGHKHELKSRKC